MRVNGTSVHSSSCDQFRNLQLSKAARMTVVSISVTQRLGLISRCYCQPLDHVTEEGGSNEIITDLVTNAKYLEWIVSFNFEKHCLGGTFSVPVFLGDFERDDPSKWDPTANIVGFFHVLGDSEEIGCGKCQSNRETHLVVTGQVTLALAERYSGGD